MSNKTQLQKNQIHELAKVYASSYASPHHITFTLAGLQTLFDELSTEVSSRTDKQIVDQTEELAAMLAARFQGYQLSDDTLYRTTTHPKAQKCWEAAVDIQEMLTSTDVENAIAELDEQEVVEPMVITTNSEPFVDVLDDSVWQDRISTKDYPKQDNTFKVGDIVAAIDQRYPLHSGSELYSAAVVVSVEPLVLVSFEADMRWGRMPADKLKVIDTATKEQLASCMRRL